MDHPQRRVSDERIERLVTEVSELKAGHAEINFNYRDDLRLGRDLS